MGIGELGIVYWVLEMYSPTQGSHFHYQFLIPNSNSLHRVDRVLALGKFLFFALVEIKACY